MNPHWGWRLVVAPGLVLLAVFTIFTWYEWYMIGLIADPAIIAEYYFGSEAMIAHGGEKYASAESYAHSALILSLLSSPVLLLFIVAEIKGNKKYTILSYGLFGLAIVVTWLL